MDRTRSLETDDRSKNAGDGKVSCSHDDDLSLKADERWYCVHTAPRKELVASSNLELQGYRHFVPTVLKKVRHARKVREVKTAFFPRYIFTIIATETQRWRPINGTIGVSSLITEKDRPKPVPVGVVEALIKVTNDLGTLDFRDEVEVGQQVRLLDGPFANLIGTLSRMDHNGRVAVLLEIMGGERLVVTDKTALQRAA